MVILHVVWVADISENNPTLFVHRLLVVGPAGWPEKNTHKISQMCSQQILRQKHTAKNGNKKIDFKYWCKLKVHTYELGRVQYWVALQCSRLIFQIIINFYQLWSYIFISFLPMSNYDKYFVELCTCVKTPMVMYFVAKYSNKCALRTKLCHVVPWWYQVFCHHDVPDVWTTSSAVGWVWVRWVGTLLIFVVFQNIMNTILF